ncbi:hypothetical protein [Halomonas rhizosphaerae]|uniref:Uncharacterized protein n=1 Tax=Halomonas rhizosphaerae TaxID=3043296 RepID=A0ABT6UUA6_9GAMM|nr:hypothetical protein [Halomonas rhizosphaerae]MDI5889542.1 hypothetical protein [Halomonas rhizosphaerae]
MRQQVDEKGRRIGQGLRGAAAGDYPRSRVHTAQGLVNRSELDVLLRYVRHDTNEMTRAMTVVAAGRILGGVDMLPGLYLALEGGLLVGGGLGRNQKKTH